MLSNKDHTTVIAEVGVNHNGNAEIACELVRLAAGAGADIVKFQSFDAEKLVTPKLDRARYQTEHVSIKSSQYDLLKHLELGRTEFKQIKAACDKNNIEFMSTPFDIGYAEFLCNKLSMKKIKIPSGELTNSPFILSLTRFKKPVLLSTGMSTLQDIEHALGILAFGFINDGREPSKSAFEESYNSERGQALLSQYVTLLHCVSAYPTPVENMNLSAMQNMQNYFNLPVGLSDHSAGILMSMVAVAFGAGIIEKHFTLDKAMDGPDHASSIDSSELKQLITGIRKVEVARGDGEKVVQVCELENMPVVLRSLVAAKDIAAGELFTETNICAMRSGGQVSATLYWDYLNKRATRAYVKGDSLE